MKKKKNRRWLSVLGTLLLALGFIYVLLNLDAFPSANDPQINDPQEVTIYEDEAYTSKQDVADYIHLYGHLPDNFITKSEANAMGWDSEKGNLWKVAKGYSIGGDVFSNFESRLPKLEGRVYYECDIDYQGGYRNDKRIVFSNDGAIYYTEDHYRTFEKLYGDD